MTSNNMKKVHATVSVVLAIILVGMCCLRISRIGLKEGLPMIAVSAVLGIAVIAFLNFYHGKDTLKKYLVGYTTFGMILVLFISNGFSLQYHYLVMCALAMVVLYFDRKFFSIYVATTGPVILFLFFAKQELMFGENLSFGLVLACAATYVAICSILYFLTKWGQETVEAAELQRAEAENSKNKVEEILNSLKDSISSIEQGVKITTTNVHDIDGSNREVLGAVKIMSNAVNKQAASITELDANMTDSLDKIYSFQANSKELISDSEVTTTHIHDGLTKINVVRNNMDTINDSSLLSVNYVEDLTNQIKVVDELLSEIQSISSQTNLLSLNASIEAARAGEAGRGFAVVAENIGTLAQQSNDIVKRISEVSEEMYQKSNMVNEQVKNEMEMTEKGRNLILEVQEYFKTVQTSVTDSNTKIARELSTMDSVTNMYVTVQKTINNLSLLLKDNVAEMGAISDNIQSQEEQISTISTQMSEISKHGEELLVVSNQ